MDNRSFDERMMAALHVAAPYIKDVAERTARMEAEAFYSKELLETKMSDTVKTPCPTKEVAVLGKRVLLVKDDAPEMSEGGIVLPSDSQEKPLTAHVIGVGKGVTQLSKGDEVVYASFAGTTFNIGGKEVIVVDEEDIMLVLREVPSDDS